MAQTQYDYSLREIQLNGDRFLLTIPSVQVWNKLMEYQKRGIIRIKQWELDCNAYLFQEDSSIGELSIVSNNSSNKICQYQKGTMPKDNFLSTDELKLWPCLIPLTREGKLDNSLSSMEGQIAEGGFFALARRGKTPQTIVGHSNHPAVWSFRYFVGLDLLDSCPNESSQPLKWCVCNGMLIGMQALVQITLRQLFDFGMIPC